jgi:outer membrane biosynthesis protein TonB
VQLLAIALATSLVLGPAPVASGPAEAPSEAPEPAAPLPDVDDPPGGEVAPEPTPEPEVEPEPAPAPEPPPPAVEPTEVSTSPDPAPVVRDKLGCNGSKSCRRMTVAGIVVGTIGLGSVGTGIGLLVKKDVVIPESPAFVTSTHPAGIVTLTVGIGVTLTAVLMLVASHRGYKQRSPQARVAPLPNGLRF